MTKLGIELWVCLGIIVVATVTDIRSRRIPNWLSFGGLALGVILHCAAGYAEDGGAGLVRRALRALAGITVCSIWPICSFLRNEIGGGDVKLFAAIGALAGPVLGFDIQGATLAVTLLIVLPWRVITARLKKTSIRPVIMAPTILVGFLLALARTWVLG
jgi:prepilin peptidase CpaA